MSTPATPAMPATPGKSDLSKLWAWIKNKAAIVEGDVVKVIGSSEAEKIASAGKAILESYLGPLALTALTDATDVVTGQMSVSKAISSLMAQAEAAGKSISSAAALQVIALTQNALPTAQDQTVTPVA